MDLQRLSSHDGCLRCVLCARVRVRVLCMRGDSGHLGERATLKRILHFFGWQAHYCNNNVLFLFPLFSYLGNIVSDQR